MGTIDFRAQEKLANLAVATSVAAEDTVPAPYIAAPSYTEDDGSGSSLAASSQAPSDFSALLDGLSAVSASSGMLVTDVVNIGSGVSLGQMSITEDRADAATPVSIDQVPATLAEAAVVERNEDPRDLALSLWYLTGDGKLICIPNVDSQFLSFGEHDKAGG